MAFGDFSAGTIATTRNVESGTDDGTIGAGAGDRQRAAERPHRQHVRAPNKGRAVVVLPILG
ncbi:hypothetical protein ACQPX6_28460 [Actinomycetospora sp. CA-101289]|uniref:hypothetical protein n=1 Tax=Actinomycetospora sp. CA-101289 TaxID=3239893 RepID=UPI003D993314